LNTSILIIAISIIVFFAISNDLIFAQERGIDEFLEWPSTDNYNFVIIAIVIMIAIGIIANYLWSSRKGRRYSEE
jgi:hypothetical protein